MLKTHRKKFETLQNTLKTLQNTLKTLPNTLKTVKNHAKTRGCKKILRAPQRVLKYCIQSNSTLADAVRMVLGRGRAILDGKTALHT